MQCTCRFSENRYTCSAILVKINQFNMHVGHVGTWWWQYRCQQIVGEKFCCNIFLLPVSRFCNMCNVSFGITYGIYFRQNDIIMVMIIDVNYKQNIFGLKSSISFCKNAQNCYDRLPKIGSVRLCQSWHFWHFITWIAS